MQIESAVIHHFDTLNVDYRLFTHAGPVTSFEQAAEDRGQRPSQIIRSLVFRLGADKFVMVLMAGPQQIPWKALRRYLGQSRVSMASKEELKTVTGYEIGAVSPFGLPQPLRILVDETVFAETEISLGSGVRGTTVIMKSAVLRELLADAEIVNFG